MENETPTLHLVSTNKDIESAEGWSQLKDPLHTRSSITEEHNVTFSIYTPSGQKIASLQKAFVRVMLLSCFDLVAQKLYTEDGESWNLRVNHKLAESLQNVERVEAIVSFQKHTFGYYAIAKLYNPQGRTIK